MKMEWKSEKRRRMHLTQTSSSDAPTATAQGHQAPISYAICLSEPGEAAKDHEGQISDMAIVQAQDHALLPRMDSEEEKTQELFGPHVIFSEEDRASYAQKLFPNIRPPISVTETMSWMDNFKLQVRQGRIRLAYYKAMNQESGCKFKEPKAYSEEEIVDHGHFKHLQEDECFEWFFHTDDSWIPDLEDYQRIVLRNFMPGRMEAEYLDVNGYRELYHTYEMDAVYVEYYGEISNKIKWIEDFLHMDARSAEWRDIETIGSRQALRIATEFPHMTVRLAAFAYTEYILELRKDASLKDLDLVYFEIWRLVIRDKKIYMDAVKEVYGMDKFHIHKRVMDAELNSAPVFWTMKQRIYWITQEQGIDFNTEYNKARDLFRKGVARTKIKNMANYAKKKMEIGEWLNLQVD
ncbi:uncharacterized protein LOC124659057 isoform X2 [Lolium rigidum]|uniref:uncharacterized protein LOC124659057 isoform X2 n=1 Tax=Lolium rigidum TaxID=89674 RepID=UPI001F5C7C35|nr:uncharacterized protein LOC124659057 isoform X2 [Lolium rigidum]